MIITEQKPFEEIVGFLEKSNGVFICGCNLCATLCKTGGEEEVKQMKKRLEEAGKKVSGWVVLDPACHILENKKHFRENKDKLAKADSILVLACGNGVQAVSESIDKIVYPGVNTLFLGDIIRFGQFEERCQLCGECLLDKTGGICPISRCSKSLLNGPCGGSENGKCEIDPDIDCAWQLIIDRLSKWGELDRLEEIITAKDWSTSRDGGPRKLNIRKPQSKKMATSKKKESEKAKTPVSSVKANSNLKIILDSGEFAVTGELGPPKGADAEVIKRKALYFKDYVDAVNITDNQTAIVRMSSIAAGIILTQMGVEPVIQMVCRDRNRLAIQSDILGAAALGIKNVLCLSGDHQKFGSHPQAKNVYDLDAIGLIQALKSMRDEKKFLGGDSLTVPPQLYIGAVENPYADPYEFRSIRLAKKIKAGCDFIQTQGVFDV
ncbi:MAG: methylenetetrahydrofolate reductase C-terminal domain-containing protein, partial [bacterium]